MDIELATTLLLVALGLVIVGAFAAHQRRQRRRIRALVERVEELAAMLEQPSENDPDPRGTRSTTSARQARGAPPADVLAGRTSTVERVIAGRSEAAGLAEEAIAAVHARLGEPQTPSTLAEDLHVSLRTLERGLRVELDCTPRQLILTMKMRQARRRLRTGSVRVSEVAHELGFSSPAHFSVRFRSFYGEPPSQIADRAGAARREAPS